MLKNNLNSDLEERKWKDNIFKDIKNLESIRNK